MADRPVLQIVIGSTRPGRTGRAVGEWFQEAAEAHGGFDVELVDLAEVDLPMFDEASHPRFGEYENDHTRRWAETVGRADAFVLVVPEYNHSFNAATKNALDFLGPEWRDKALGFVSYGGVSAGTRAVLALEPVVSVLGMRAVGPAVHIPFVAQFVDDDGRLRPNSAMSSSAAAVLDELQRWNTVLAPLRQAAARS